MDKIDSFVINAQQVSGSIDFTFVISEDDISAEDRENIIDYIDYFVRKLNKRIPQFTFTWNEAHKTKPEDVIGEIIHQILVQSRFN